MRTTQLSLIAVVAAATMAACTVSDVDAPPLAGPSTLARTILMHADRDSISQDGSDFATIDIRAQVQPGQSENVRLRAQVFVDGVAQDFGTLSNKSPITPTTITYRAPAAPTTASGQVPTVVTISVIPFDSGDFRSEFSREIDIRLIPPGVILPTNPSLVAAFTFLPAAPLVMGTVTFNASTSLNQTVACGINCQYTWDFGDGTSATGQVVTHQFRTVGSFAVRLTVTDSRGATAIATQVVPVAPGTPPTAVFTRSPTGGVGVNQPVFFDASASTPAVGRTIVRYDWSFGDGEFAQGVIVTHRYTAAGVYAGQLITIDDAGTRSVPAAVAVTVGTSSGPTPTAAVTCTVPTGTRTANCNASASTPGNASNIESYTFNWGDGSPDEVQTNPVQSHAYAAAGTFVVTMTVRDTQGRTAVAQTTVTIP